MMRMMKLKAMERKPKAQKKLFLVVAKRKKKKNPVRMKMKKMMKFVVFVYDR